MLRSGGGCEVGGRGKELTEDCAGHGLGLFAVLEAGKALAAVGMSLVNTQADSLVSHHLLPRGWGRGLAGPAGWAACTLN